MEVSRQAWAFPSPLSSGGEKYLLCGMIGPVCLCESLLAHTRWPMNQCVGPVTGFNHLGKSMALRDKKGLGGCGFPEAGRSLNPGDVQMSFLSDVSLSLW